MKNLLTLSFVLLFAFCLKTNATTCSSISLSSQAAVDAWASNGCDTISGDLTLSGTISNVDSFASLVYIEGYLRISTNIADMSGLDNLDAIGEYFTIQAVQVDSLVLQV